MGTTIAVCAGSYGRSTMTRPRPFALVIDTHPPCRCSRERDFQTTNSWGCLHNRHGREERLVCDRCGKYGDRRICFGEILTGQVHGHRAGILRAWIW